MILIQYTFCQIRRISPHGPLSFRSVCGEKKSSVSIHSPSSVIGKQTGVKYQLFSRVSTKHSSYTGQTNVVRYSREFEGALKGGVYLFGC